ncbi:MULTISPECIES: hypothetical protein [unclassified Streptomyces]
MSERKFKKIQCWTYLLAGCHRPAGLTFDLNETRPPDSTSST